MVLRILFLRVSKPVFAKTRPRNPLRNFLAFLAKKQAEEVLVKALADQNEQFGYEHGLFRELGKPKQILHVRILLDGLDCLDGFSSLKFSTCFMIKAQTIMRAGLLPAPQWLFLKRLLYSFSILGQGRRSASLTHRFDLLNPERDSWSSYRSCIRYCE